VYWTAYIRTIEYAENNSHRRTKERPLSESGRLLTGRGKYRSSRAESDELPSKPKVKKIFTARADHGHDQSLPRTTTSPQMIDTRLIPTPESIAIRLPVGPLKARMPEFIAVVHIGFPVVLKILPRSLHTIVEALALHVPLILRGRTRPRLLRPEAGRLKAQQSNT
jgi:hypothetical protein